MCGNLINLFFRVPLEDLVTFDLGFGFWAGRGPLSQILVSGGLKYAPNNIICLIGLQGYIIYVEKKFACDCPTNVRLTLWPSISWKMAKKDVSSSSHTPIIKKCRGSRCNCPFLPKAPGGGVETRRKKRSKTWTLTRTAGPSGMPRTKRTPKAQGSLSIQPFQAYRRSKLNNQPSCLYPPECCPGNGTFRE